MSHFIQHSNWIVFFSIYTTLLNYSNPPLSFGVEAEPEDRKGTAKARRLSFPIPPHAGEILNVASQGKEERVDFLSLISFFVFFLAFFSPPPHPLYQLYRALPFPGGEKGHAHVKQDTELECCGQLCGHHHYRRERRWRPKVQKGRDRVQGASRLLP